MLGFSEILIKKKGFECSNGTCSPPSDERLLYCNLLPFLFVESAVSLAIWFSMLLKLEESGL